MKWVKLKVIIYVLNIMISSRVLIILSFNVFPIVEFHKHYYIVYSCQPFGAVNLFVYLSLSTMDSFSLSHLSHISTDSDNFPVYN